MSLKFNLICRAALAATLMAGTAAAMAGEVRVMC